MNSKLNYHFCKVLKKIIRSEYQHFIICTEPNKLEPIQGQTIAIKLLSSSFINHVCDGKSLNLSLMLKIKKLRLNPASVCILN